MKWISVLDRLPDKGESVYKVFTKGKNYRSDLWYEDNRWWYGTYDFIDEYEGTVTHWIPTPELPEPEGVINGMEGNDEITHILTCEWCKEPLIEILSAVAICVEKGFIKCMRCHTKQDFKKEELLNEKKSNKT